MSFQCACRVCGCALPPGCVPQRGYSKIRTKCWACAQGLADSNPNPNHIPTSYSNPNPNFNPDPAGLADPAPVAQTFFMDDFLRERLVLDAIVTVVDAKHVTQHLDDVKPEGVENEARAVGVQCPSVCSAPTEAHASGTASYQSTTAFAQQHIDVQNCAAPGADVMHDLGGPCALLSSPDPTPLSFSRQSWTMDGWLSMCNRLYLLF